MNKKSFKAFKEDNEKPPLSEADAKKAKEDQRLVEDQNIRL